ncbi:MAG: GNAT family N-acetyltransferase [Pseudomonadota bacterium]
MIEEICELRHHVWLQAATNVTRQSPKQWRETIDETATHFIVRSDMGMLVASARVSLHRDVSIIPDKDDIVLCFPDWSPDLPIAWLNRLVVHPSARSAGLGTRCDQERIKWAKQAGALAIGGTVIGWRKQSFLKMGFEELGEIPGHVHGKYDEPTYLIVMAL